MPNLLNVEDSYYYQFENRLCRDCKEQNYCILIEKEWFCEKCLGWSIKYTAKIKDDVRKLLIQCGLEDIENNAPSL